jgi:uncharacterized membrane protein YraQ (UPF0718 family)
MISLLKKGIQMNPAYFIFVNFAGFLLIFNLLVEPIKAITISAVASLMINIIIFHMIKPLLDEVATETEERILEKLEDKICQGISFETNSFNRSLRGLVYDIISKERWRSRQ